MKAERWHSVDRIFHDALEQPPHERRRFIERECAGDLSVLEEVQTLLDSYDEAGDFLQPSLPSLVGQTFNSYQVRELIAVGGMGEVYLAHDFNLKRNVAIKILPDTFAQDAERVARFQREAEILASLNHPNIAAIYDLERFGDRRLLILELVEGETLDRHLARGPIPLKEALRIASQLADALEAAHEKGIVHRDLKPSNIKITPNGTVKVLDFGIAKAPAAEADAPPEFMTPSKPGSVLGTAAYMSPEQAGRKDAGRTSDIWSFGCVLYEMLTGHRAFQGESVSAVLASVSKEEPDWERLPPQTPESVRRLLRRCLRKERKQRLHDMADARIEIDEAQTDLENPATSATKTRPWRGPRVWIAALVVLSLIAAVGIFIRRAPAEPTRRLELAALPTNAPSSFAISPDGGKIVFEATVDGRSSLWLRALDSGVARPLHGTESGRTYSPFWSPDSQSIAFFAYSEDTRLQRLDIESGSIQTLANIGAAASGGAWGAKGVILYSVGGALFSVPDTGGKPKTVLDDEGIYTAPHFLPEGRAFLYNARLPGDLTGTYISDLDGAAPRRIVKADGGVEYNGSGKLFFVIQGTLFAQSFNPDRAELTGQRTTVAEQVLVFGPKAAMSVSQAGPIVYRTKTPEPDAQLAWLDRTGREIQKVGEPFVPAYGLALSPNGRYVAYVRSIGRTSNIWLRDLNKNTATPFASESAMPAWSPDGSRLVYCKAGTIESVYQKAITGDGPEELLAASAASPDWSAAGSVLFERADNPTQPRDLWAMPVNARNEAAGQPVPMTQTSADERTGRFSPDGKWMAYSSNKSGRREIYARSIAGKGTEVQISIDGGVQARWRGDGNELFYLAPDGRLMTVQMKVARDGIDPGTPVPLFTMHAFGTFESYATTYVASGDGQRFLALTSKDAMSPVPIKLILNWKAP